MSGGQKPSVGRVVHCGAPQVVDDDIKIVPVAAIVTATRAEDPSLPDDFAVHLCLLTPTGIVFARGFGRSDTLVVGSWSWPPRV